MSTYIKCKEVRHIEAEQIENLFAGNIRQLLMEAQLDYDKLYEIRLRVGRPLFLTYDGWRMFPPKTRADEQYLCYPGGSERDYWSTSAGYSLYAYEDEIRQGLYQRTGRTQSRGNRQSAPGQGNRIMWNEIYFLY